VDTWVMSCRAFARRIEHHCLEILFEHFGLEEVVFDYQTTPKNGALQAFLAELLGGPPMPGARLSRALFTRRCPALFHSVKVLADE